MSKKAERKISQYGFPAKAVKNYDVPAINKRGYYDTHGSWIDEFNPWESSKQRRRREKFEKEQARIEREALASIEMAGIF